MGKVPPEESRVHVTGYLPAAEDIHTSGASPLPYSVEAVVAGVDFRWDLSETDQILRAVALDNFLMTRPEGADATFEIPKPLRARYYRHYVALWQDQPSPELWFRSGTSGMPVLDEKGDVVAILSAYYGGPSGGSIALVVPVEEIKELLEKVNGMRR